MCGTFYYGIGVNMYGDRLFDAHAGVSIGNIATMSLQNAVTLQRQLVSKLYSEYAVDSYCPMRDPKYQRFFQECLAPYT